MISKLADELIELVDYKSQQFRNVADELTVIKSSPEKWSLKEILGHLIDSAANNHQRFVRAQNTISLVFPKYDQNKWIKFQGYQESNWIELLSLWRLYNRHIAHIIKRIPAEKLGLECEIVPYDPVTLNFLVEDYLDHLKHHLEQIDELLGERMNSNKHFKDQAFTR